MLSTFCINYNNVILSMKFMSKIYVFIEIRQKWRSSIDWCHDIDNWKIKLSSARWISSTHLFCINIFVFIIAWMWFWFTMKWSRFKFSISCDCFKKILCTWWNIRMIFFRNILWASLACLMLNTSWQKRYEWCSWILNEWLKMNCKLASELIVFFNREKHSVIRWFRWTQKSRKWSSIVKINVTHFWSWSWMSMIYESITFDAIKRMISRKKWRK